MSALSSIPAIVVPAAKRHTSTLIFLHGLGDTGNGWSFLSENWRLRSKFTENAFIFPHAPAMPITVNMGMSMPAWFDIVSLGGDISKREDRPGILNSVEVLHGVIEEQINKGIPSERIVIGGFSQGGAIALLAGLTSKHKLGGIVALSTWLPCHEKVEEMAGEANKNIHIFQGHGEADQIVQLAWGQRSRDIAKKIGANVEWHQYPGLPHSADPEEIDHMEAWLAKRLPNLD